LWGITFLIGWFTAVVNWTWERGITGPRHRHPALLFAGVYLAVMLWLGKGRGWLCFLLPQRQCVASLSPTKEGIKISNDLLQAVIRGKATDEKISQFRTATNAGEAALLTRSEREAVAAAKIIFWAETAAYLLKQDEPDLPARGRALASKYRIYLGLTLGTWTPKAQYPLENKIVLIDPKGEIAWQYLKSRPTPGPEAAMSAKSDSRLRELDTPYGRLSATICSDMDFPKLMAQAGDQKAD
jgi:apolipoprotein N-acyltransferase